MQGTSTGGRHRQPHETSTPNTPHVRQKTPVRDRRLVAELRIKWQIQACETVRSGTGIRGLDRPPSRASRPSLCHGPECVRPRLHVDGLGIWVRRKGQLAHDAEPAHGARIRLAQEAADAEVLCEGVAVAKRVEEGLGEREEATVEDD